MFKDELAVFNLKSPDTGSYVSREVFDHPRRTNTTQIYMHNISEEPKKNDILTFAAFKQDQFSKLTLINDDNWKDILTEF